MGEKALTPVFPQSFVDAICAEVGELTGNPTLADYTGPAVQFSAKEEGGVVLAKAVLSDVDEIRNKLDH